ncbi:MAG: restriction endonuclease subunit S [Desulfobacteraceae bacterium]|nr:MAG: restriction endonuclease subunit S [Desulfobacteraceae bacterium]
MDYQLSETVNQDKIFLVKRSDLEGRLDCEYYKPERKLFFTRLRANNYIDKLMTAIKDGSYGVLPPGDCYDDCHPVKFLRATDLKPDLNLSFESYKKVPQKYFDNHKRARLRRNDILIAVKGATIASNKSVAFVSSPVENAIVNGSIFRFQCTDLYIPEFIAFMLELPSTKKQLKYNLVANNAVDYVDKSIIKNLLVYLPPIGIQKQILTKMHIVYAEKKQKEAQAQQLLDSINSYLLNELGIELPPEEKNTIRQRMFFRKFSEVSAGRFDAAAFQQQVENTRKAIKSGIFNTDKLKHVVKFKAEQVTEIDARTYIGLENIQSNTGEYLPSEEKTSISSAGTFKQDDILFPKLRPYLNKVFHASFDGVCSTEFHVLQASKIDPAFFSFFLRSKAVVNQTTCLMTGNTLPRLQTIDIQDLDIPLPPLEKQTEIAAHIQAIRNRAKQLRVEAAAGLEQAKREVEAMIIGETSH